MAKPISVETLVDQLIAQDRLSLAKAITLVESARPKDQLDVDSLLHQVRVKNKNTSFRVGLSGVPGVGKSSIIEQLGLRFIEAGHRVAVLAIDPSSDLTKGSILGDKTRMEELSKKNEAFIRPTPSRGHLGGVSISTMETIALCEAAGYDIVMVETVGVGQSEAAVADLVDCFLFLALPGSGDELQGIKRGVLEHIDMALVNKFDGSNKVLAELAQKQLKASLRILRSEEIPVHLTSAINGHGLSEVEVALMEFRDQRQAFIEERRRQQELKVLEGYVLHFMKARWLADKAVDPELAMSLKSLSRGTTGARAIAKSYLDKLLD